MDTLIPTALNRRRHRIHGTPGRPCAGSTHRPRSAPGPDTNIAVSLVTDIDEHVRHRYRRAGTARPDIGARPATSMPCLNPRRYQTPHCGDQYRRSMTSPRYCPMHGPEKQPESKRPGTCPPWSVCVPTTVASPQSISRVAMCPSISRRPVCPPDRWSISVPGRHPADRQSPGAAGSAIDIGYMASGLISMPARACASSDIGAIPRAYVPADIAGCRHTLRYRIRIIEHGYNKSIELP